MPESLHVLLQLQHWPHSPQHGLFLPSRSALQSLGELVLLEVLVHEAIQKVNLALIAEVTVLELLALLYP